MTACTLIRLHAEDVSLGNMHMLYGRCLITSPGLGSPMDSRTLGTMTAETPVRMPLVHHRQSVIAKGYQRAGTLEPEDRGS